MYNTTTSHNTVAYIQREEKYLSRNTVTQYWRLRHGRRILKELTNFFKFAVRNPSQSSSLATILVYFRLIFSSLVFFYPRKLLFWGQNYSFAQFCTFEKWLQIATLRKKNFKQLHVAPYEINYWFTFNWWGLSTRCLLPDNNSFHFINNLFNP